MAASQAGRRGGGPRGQPATISSCAPPGSTAPSAATSSRRCSRPREDATSCASSPTSAATRPPRWIWPTALLDIAETLARRRSRGLGETYHLAGSGEASWYDLAEAVMECRRRLGLRVATLAPISATSIGQPRAERPRYSVAQQWQIRARLRRSPASTGAIPSPRSSIGWRLSNDPGNFVHQL